MKVTAKQLTEQAADLSRLTERHWEAKPLQGGYFLAEICYPQGGFTTYSAILPAGQLGLAIEYLRRGWEMRGAAAARPEPAAPAGTEAPRDTAAPGAVPAPAPSPDISDLVQVAREMPGRRSIRVFWDTGECIPTDINGTEKEICAYYLGKKFNLGGQVERDAMAVAVQFMDRDGLPIYSAPGHISEAEAVRAQAARIRELISENLKLRRATDGLLNAFAPKVAITVAELGVGALQSDVRRAWEILQA